MEVHSASLDLLLLASSTGVACVKRKRVLGRW